MALEIRKYPDPILKNKAEAVKEINAEVLELIEKMKQTLSQEQEGRIKGVGLAAPQVGVSKRIIVIAGKNGVKAFINPEIVKKSREKDIDKEGCLSLPGLWLDIRRSVKAKIRVLDETGKEIEIEAQGFMARVFQHEIDHLSGILFFERLPFLQRWKVKRILDKTKFNNNQ